MHRNEGIDPNLFGHGDATGAWLLWVNLARDCLSLQGQEISNWDTWRDYKDQTTPLSKTGIAQCDDIASLIDVLEEQPETATADLPGQPFWR